MKCQRLAGIMVYCPPEPILRGLVTGKTPHFNLVNRYNFNRNTVPAPVEIIIIDLPYPRFDTSQRVGNGVLGYSRVLAVACVPLPVTIEKNMRERIVGLYAL
jgi:hypothetical protein